MDLFSSGAPCQIPSFIWNLTKFSLTLISFMTLRLGLNSKTTTEKYKNKPFYLTVLSQRKTIHDIYSLNSAPPSPKYQIRLQDLSRELWRASPHAAFFRTPFITWDSHKYGWRDHLQLRWSLSRCCCTLHSTPEKRRWWNVGLELQYLWKVFAKYSPRCFPGLLPLWKEFWST